MEHRTGPPTRAELDALYARARAVCADAQSLRESGYSRHQRMKAEFAAMRAREFELASRRRPTAFRRTLARDPEETGSADTPS